MHKGHLCFLGILFLLCGTMALQINAMAENELGVVEGASYTVQNTKEGAILTITAKDAIKVKKIQQTTQQFAAANTAAGDENVICPVYGTKIKKSQAYETAVYKGKTYYFCCAGCKPAFLKHPEKYVK